MFGDALFSGAVFLAMDGAQGILCARTNVLPLTFTPSPNGLRTELT